MRAKCYKPKIEQMVFEGEVIDEEIKRPVEKDIDDAANAIAIYLQWHKPLEKRVGEVYNGADKQSDSG